MPRRLPCRIAGVRRTVPRAGTSTLPAARSVHALLRAATFDKWGPVPLALPALQHW